MKKILKILFVILILSVSACTSDSNDNTTQEPIVNNTSVISVNQSSIQKIIDFHLENLPSNISNIDWDFGDGNVFYGTSSDISIKHIYEFSGNYTIRAKIYSGNNVINATKNIVINNGQPIKVTKITILSYPTKLCLSSTGFTFSGQWDQTFYYGSGNTVVDVYSDTYLKIGRIIDKPNTDNPNYIDTSVYHHLYTSPVHINQVNNVFDLSNQNIIINLLADQILEIDIFDSDEANSLYENGNSDEYISSPSINNSAFVNNNFIWTEGNLQLRIEYINL